LLIDPAVSAALGLFLAVLLAASAAHKAKTFREFAGVIENYRLAPRGAVPLIAPVILFAEAMIALCLLVPALRAEAATLAAVLFSLYGAAMAINLLRGRREIDCGCSFGAGGDRLTWSLVLRNLALVAAALFVAAPAGTRELGAFDVLTIGVFVVGGGLVYLTAEALRANWSKFVAAGYR